VDGVPFCREARKLFWDIIWQSGLLDGQLWVCPKYLSTWFEDLSFKEVVP